MKSAFIFVIILSFFAPLSWGFSADNTTQAYIARYCNEWDHEVLSDTPFSGGDFFKTVPKYLQDQVFAGILARAIAANPREYTAITCTLICVRNFGTIKGLGGDKQIQMLLHDPEPLLRRDVVEILGQLDAAANRASLINSLNDTSDTVRTAAVWAIKKCPNAQGVLKKYVHDHRDQKDHYISVGNAVEALQALNETPNVSQ